MHRLNWRDGDPDIMASFVIPEGAVFASVSDQLVEKGILPKRDKWLLKIQAKRMDADKRLAIGTVELPLNASVNTIIEGIVNVPREIKTLTIIEGWDLHDIKDYLVEQDIKGAKDLFDYTGVPGRDYREQRGQPKEMLSKNYAVLKHKPWYVSMEGYLFPDTYDVFENATVEDVLDKMLSRMDHFIDIGAVENFNFVGWTVHEALTVASIIEQEVQKNDDRRKVSDIIIKRNSVNWALQMDSTVNYATRGDKPAVSIAETKVDSPYNTYKYPGLPLGPIAAPSKNSMEATLNPWGNQFYYFLTDSSGTVYYGESLDQHNANKARYLK